VATTDKTFYLVAWRPAYAELVGMPEGSAERALVVISQGGFGQDVTDFERQVKERFLEAELSYQGVDLERTAEVFDRYFTIEELATVVDLDEES
jgi:hypothetical protein